MIGEPHRSNTAILKHGRGPPDSHAGSLDVQKIDFCGPTLVRRVLYLRPA